MSFSTSIASMFFLFLVCLSSPTTAQQPQAVVNGQLFAKSNHQPASGLVVSLVHPFIGRSAPTTSDLYGRFTFFGIPRRTDPYYMEVYWGNQLVYRQTIFVTLPQVNLPPNYL